MLLVVQLHLQGDHGLGVGQLAGDAADLIALHVLQRVLHRCQRLIPVLALQVAVRILHHSKKLEKQSTYVL